MNTTIPVDDDETEGRTYSRAENERTVDRHDGLEKPKIVYEVLGRLGYAALTDEGIALLASLLREEK